MKSLQYLKLWLLLLASYAHADYISDSILCDDVEAICIQNKIEVITDPQAYCEDKVAFANPTICNCGALCIKYLDEGEQCYLSFIVGTSQSMCGYGLDCIKEDPNDVASLTYCVRNPSKLCVYNSIEYEKKQAAGVVGPGTSKPNCDEFGQYAAKQCTPGQTCYCVDVNNERLFGEELEKVSENMTCTCSRYHLKTGNWENNALRCLPDGNFDPLQCFGDFCYCYDERTHTVTKGPFSMLMIREMDCYDPNIHNIDYKNPCDVALAQHEELVTQNTEAIVIGDTSTPICTPDGYFAPVQKRATKSFCSDQFGNQIEEFVWPSYNATYMNCYCARRRAVMRAAGYNELPTCCKNGGFSPIQKHGLYFYCVDNNGNQLGKEVLFSEVNNLSCNQIYNCAEDN